MAVSTTTTITNGVAEGAETDKLKFDSIPDCIAAYARGEFLLVLDAPTRENEGDLIIAASALTPSKAAFLIRYSSGYLCAPLSAARAVHLNLPPMVPLAANSDPNQTAYTVTVDATPTATNGVTTGISAADRSATALALAGPATQASHFRRPGHVLPLVAREGGVRERMGHTEAAWEFSRLAGYEPAVAMIAELVEDGEADMHAGVSRPEMASTGMMRGRACLEFGRRWGIRCCTIEALKEWVLQVDGPLDIAADAQVKHPAVNGEAKH